MCVSSGPAELSGTQGYVGEANHPVHGYVHVLGYQNTAQNLVEVPNAMLLPIPTSVRLGKENVFSVPSDFFSILENALNPTKGRTMSYNNSATRGGYVERFEHGIYDVVVTDDPLLAGAALESVPDEKRPQISTELLAWYKEKYPGWALAVCCFTTRKSVKADPLFWWYKPTEPSVLFFPAVDSHDGGIPDLSGAVYRDHRLFMGSLTPDFPEEDVVELSDLRYAYEEARQFFPPHIVGGRWLTRGWLELSAAGRKNLEEDQTINGDFYWNLNTPRKSGTFVVQAPA